MPDLIHPHTGEVHEAGDIIRVVRSTAQITWVHLRGGDVLDFPMPFHRVCKALEVQPTQFIGPATLKAWQRAQRDVDRGAS